MRSIILVLLSILFLAVPPSVPAATSSTDMTPPQNGLTPLKALLGEWRGKDPEGKPVTTSFRLTSGGASVTETLTPAGKPAMTTVYYKDGKDLMLTHYCSLGNQPRMRAKEYKEGDKTMTFFFVDATNLESPTAMHMHQVKFEFVDNNHFTQTWTSMKGGKEVPPHVFKFERVK